MSLARLAMYIGSHGQVSLRDGELEEIIREYQQFSYLDKRKKVPTLLSFATRNLFERYENIAQDPERFLRIRDHHPQLRQGMSVDDLMRWQYANRINADSGVFPDAVLRYVPEECFGNGLLLELKSAKDFRIASFNSTLPAPTKRLSQLSIGVRSAAYRYDLLEGVAPDTYSEQERLVYYFVRVKSEHDEFISALLPGGIFSPHSELQTMKLLFVSLFEAAGLQAQADGVRETIDKLALLGRDRVSVSRHIEGAQFTMRLRIMAESKMQLRDFLQNGRFSVLIDKAAVRAEDIESLGNALRFEGGTVSVLDGNLLQISQANTSVRFAVSEVSPDWVDSQFYCLTSGGLP